MRKQLLYLLLLSFPTLSWAQQETENCDEGPDISQLHFETRLGWEGYNVDGKADHDNMGFKGQCFNLRFDGRLYKTLTFSYRQRLSKRTGQTFWDATDWVHLDWQINPRWGLSAGKQVVAIGGYEYDRAPIDLYYCSEFWNQIPCYQLGVSGSFQASDNDKLLLQVCNSPFRTWAGNDTYGVNLVWYGQHGCWETMWSANAFEYKRGKWISYMALGNRFNIGNRVNIDFDYTNRASSFDTFLGFDFTLGLELSVKPHESTRLFAKYTYDQNHSDTDADLLVTDGTEMHMAGGGIEVSPIKQYRDGLRLFAAGAYNWGTNTNPDGVKRDKELVLEAGLKFRLDILDAFKRVLKK